MNIRKALQVTLALGLALAVMITPSATKQAWAQAGLPALCTGFQLQNTDTGNSATVNLSFYNVSGGNNNGTPDYSPAAISIPASGSTSKYVPSAYSTLPSGSYSIVVSSDRQLNSLVNQVDCSTGGLNVGASYSGISSTNTGNTVYLAFVMSRAFGAQNWSSAIAIQNAGSNPASSVQIQFFRSGQATAVETFTTSNLTVGDTWYLDLSTGQYASANLANFSGAAKITSTGVPVAVVTNYAPGDGSRILSYNGVTSGGQKLYATQVSRNYAAGQYQGGLSLYNLGGTSTPIQIDFYAAGSAVPVHSLTTSVGGDSTYSLYMGPGGPLDGVAAMSSFNGSAVVQVTSGSNNLVGIFNLNSAVGAAGAANMMPATQATLSVTFPQIVRSIGSGPFEAGWQIVNTTGTTANLTIKYVKSDGTVTQSNTTLGGNSALSTYVGGSAGAPLGTGWNGSLVVTSDQPIVGQANFINLGAGAKDSLLIYNGFNN